MEKFYIFILKKRVMVRFGQKKYHKILKTFNCQWANREPSAIYRNYIRVLCLYEIGNSAWKAEYGHILNTNQLDLLGQSDANYLKHFFFRWAGGDESQEFRVSGFTLNEVSETTKYLFPLDLLATRHECS